MLNIELFRDQADKIRKSEEKRGRDPGKVDEVIEIDQEWREKLQELQKLQEKRNTVGDKIAEKKKEGEDASDLIEEMQEVKQKIKDLEEQKESLKEERDELRFEIGNIMHESVPKGEDEDDNVPIETWNPDQGKKVEGELAADLIQDNNLAITDKASEVSGERAYYLEDDLFRLNQALIRFSMDILREKDYRVLQTPYMLMHEPMEAAAELEDFEEQLYRLEDTDKYMIATSEQTLAALKYDEIIEEQELPVKYAGFSTNFRREAGKHGQETRGIWRVHQFEKVEQFIFAHPDNSWDLHKELLENAKEVFRKLELPFRVVNVCTGDLGNTAAKKYDIEVWRPPLEEYGEVVSCSNCTVYQATKLNARVRNNEGENYNVHTLNATACATQRTITAIIENHQTEEGIRIPEALQPYMNGQEIIETN